MNHRESYEELLERLNHPSMSEVVVANEADLRSIRLRDLCRRAAAELSRVSGLLSKEGYDISNLECLSRELCEADL